MKENMGDEELGKPKSHCMGSPTVLLFFYKCRESRQVEGLFPSKIGTHIVRRTISFCNRKLQFACWRKLGGIFKCCAMDFVEEELFHFQLYVH